MRFILYSATILSIVNITRTFGLALPYHGRYKDGGTQRSDGGYQDVYRRDLDSDLRESHHIAQIAHENAIKQHQLSAMSNWHEWHEELKNGNTDNAEKARRKGDDLHAKLPQLEKYAAFHKQQQTKPAVWTTDEEKRHALASVHLSVEKAKNHAQEAVSANKHHISPTGWPNEPPHSEAHLDHQQAHEEAYHAHKAAHNMHVYAAEEFSQAAERHRAAKRFEAARVATASAKSSEEKANWHREKANEHSRYANSSSFSEHSTQEVKDSAYNARMNGIAVHAAAKKAHEAARP